MQSSFVSVFILAKHNKDGVHSQAKNVKWIPLLVCSKQFFGKPNLHFIPAFSPKKCTNDSTARVPGYSPL